MTDNSWSRRKFLSTVTASTFIFGLGGILKNGCTNKNAGNFRFVFMSDIHIQPEKSAAEGFKKAIKHVNKLRPKPKFVITGGDLVMDVLAHDYERADMLFNLYQSTVKELEMPVYNTIGNHDIFGWSEKSEVSESHPEYGKEMFKKRLGDGKTYRSFDFNNWHFILLDSIEKLKEGGYHGYINNVQFEWLRKDLEKTGSERSICVCLHIPFVSVRKQIHNNPISALSKGTLVNNGNDVIKLLSNYNVQLVLQGHLHVVEEIKYKKTTYITAGAVSANWWKGPHLGHPEGFIIVDVEGDTFNWKYETYGWTAE